MKNNKKKELDKNYIIVAVIAVIILLVIGFALVKGCSKSGDEDNPEEVKKIAATEENIIKAYGMSKEDAINKVMTIYNSDNYEYSATINDDSKYVVSVKNLITENVDKYIVDPISGAFYEE